MLRAADGATIKEITSDTGWQSHYTDVRDMPMQGCKSRTVRGAMAGGQKRKLGLEVISDKVDRRWRAYRILAS